MLTVFTTPKPFAGLTAVHERNAIGSWLTLGANVIVLEGGESIKGTHTWNIRHADVRCNQNGLPYVDAMYNEAQRLAGGDLLVHANADVVFLPDLLDAVERAGLSFTEFLMCGQRWDVDLDEALDFEGDWQQAVLETVADTGELHSPSGKDWFAFKRPLRLDIPPLLIGRAGWDNWILDTAVRVGIPVIDATPCVTCVHPRHDYWHLPGGLREAHIDGPEATYNKELANVPTNKGRISEATWVMTPDELKKKT